MSKGKNPGKRKTKTPPETLSAGKNEKTREEISKKPMLNWLLLLVAVLPFLFSWETMDPSLTVRYGLLAGFVLLFFLYFYGFRKKLITGGWPLLVRVIFILGIAFGIWNMSALFLAVNKQQVYYGISRHFLNMLLLFIVTQIATQEEKYLLHLCKLLTIAAMIHSLIGVSQFYDVAFNDLPGSYKPYGFMGNRNLFGSAQILLLPFAIFVLYKGAMFWKYLATLAIVGIISSAILSQTRSSWLAGMTAIVIAMVLVIIFSPANRKKWIIGTVAGLATTITLAFLFVSTDSGGELSQSLKERTTTIFNTDTINNSSGAANNASERLKIWSKTAELIKDNPLLGVGPGNWRLVVAKYGSEGLAWAKGKFIPDSPHNDYLLVVAESGIPGALFYIGMWFLIAVLAFKTIVKPQTEERRILNILLLSGLIGYAVDSMFSFPAERIEHTLYVYLIAGIIVGSFINNAGTQASHSSYIAGKQGRLKNWVLSLCILIAAFNLFLSIKRYNFEKYLILSKMHEQSGAFQQSIDEGNKGKSVFASIPPNGFPIETYIAMSYKGLKNYPAALKEMDAAIKIHPYNKALYLNKGTIYTTMGFPDTAITWHLKALKLTPEFDLIYFNLASNYFQLKNYKAALEALSKTDIGDHQGLKAIKEQSEYQLSIQNQSGNTPVQQQ